MKKVGLFVIIIAVMTVIAVGGWYYLKPPRKGVASAEVLPADTLLMVELFDLEKSINDFKTGKLGQKLKEIALADVMQKLEVPSEVIAKYKKIRSSVLSTIDSMLFKELFGKETVVAVLPINIDKPEPEELKKAVGSVVLISRPKHNADFAGFINRVFAKKLGFRTEAYSGYEIQSFNLEHDLSIHSCLADGLLIASLDQQTVKKCLDFRVSHQTSLFNYKYYQELRDRLGSSEMRSFVYNNTEKTYDSILKIVRSVSSKKNNSTVPEHSFEFFKGLTAIAFASYDDGSDLLRDEMLVMFDKSGLHPVYARAYGFEPEKNKTLQMVPHNTIAYYWANTMDLQSYLDFYSEESGLNDEERKSVEAKFEKEVGIGLDEMFQAFGNEFGLVLTDINTGGPFPIPKLTIFAELANKDIFIKLIQSAMQKSGMELQKEKFEDVELNYLVLPFGSDVQPSYALFNGFCVASINKQLIKDMISTYKNGKDITSDMDFQYIDKGLTDKNNSVMFVKLDQLIDKTKQIVDWANNLMAFKNQGAVKKGKIIVNEVVNPVLDGLKMYKTIGIRSIIKENEIKADRYYRIER